MIEAIKFFFKIGWDEDVGKRESMTRCSREGRVICIVYHKYYKNRKTGEEKKEVTTDFFAR